MLPGQSTRACLLVLGVEREPEQAEWEFSSGCAIGLEDRTAMRRTVSLEVRCSPIPSCPQILVPPHNYNLLYSAQGISIGQGSTLPGGPERMCQVHVTRACQQRTVTQGKEKRAAPTPKASKGLSGLAFSWLKFPGPLKLGGIGPLGELPAVRAAAESELRYTSNVAGLRFLELVTGLTSWQELETC